MDDRTKAYFEKIKENVGHLGTNNGWYTLKEMLDKKGILESSELKLLDTYNGYADSSNIEVYQYRHPEGYIRFCAELSYRTAVDDYNIEAHIFSKKPSRDDVVIIRTISDLDFKMKFKKLDPVFSCWECGKETHWLDIEGSFKEKVERWKDKYCGC